MLLRSSAESTIRRVLGTGTATGLGAKVSRLKMYVKKLTRCL
jgi:hypothetical protein